MADKRQVALMVVETVLDAIRGFGGRGVPSGHLYANLMQYMSLDSYNAIIDVLTRADLITNTGHLLCITDKGVVKEITYAS